MFGLSRRLPAAARWVASPAPHRCATTAAEQGSAAELAAPTRRLLIALHDWTGEQAQEQRTTPSEIRFTRRAAREALGWTATQLAHHLERLCRHEYVVRIGGGGGKLCQYQLLYDGRGRAGQPALLGLVDADSLREPSPTPITTTPNLSAQIATSRVD